MGNQGGESLAFDAIAHDDDMASRQAQIAANFRANVGPYMDNTVEGLELRLHQPPIFGELDEIFRDTAYDRVRRILMSMACGSGKSTLGLWTANMVGVGEGGPKGLFVTSRVLGIEDQLGARQRFAPHMRPRVLKSTPDPEALDEADFLLTTYSSIQAMDRGWLRELAAGTDVHFWDEIHSGQGPQTSVQVAEASETGTNFFISATPREAQEIYGIEHSVSRISARDAIHMGVTNPARLFAIYSGVTVEYDVGEGRGGYTSLIDHDDRNKLMTDTMHALVARHGMNGMGQFHRGGNSRHAQMMADQLSERKKSNGEYINAQAIGTFLPESKREKRLQALYAGEIDVLTATDYLIESANPPRGVGFVLAAEASGSKARMEQMAGRGARFRDPPGPTHYMVMFDRLLTNRRSKRLYTVFDVFDVPVLEQGLTLEPDPIQPVVDLLPESSAKKQSDERPRPARPSFQEFRSKLPKNVQDAMDTLERGTILEDLTLLQSEYVKPPPGYMPLVELPVIESGQMAYTTAQYMLDGLTTADLPGFNPDGDELRSIYVVSGGRLWVLPEAQQILEARTLPDQSRQVTRSAINNFFRDQGWPQPKFDNIVGSSNEAGAEFTTKTSRKVLTWEPDQAEKLLEHMASFSFIDPDQQIAIPDLVRALGISHRSVFDRTLEHGAYAERFKPHLGEHRIGRKPRPFAIVDTISVAKAAELIEATRERIARSKPSRSIQAASKKLQNVDAQAVVERAQAQIRSLTLPDLKPIPKANIKAFIDRYRAQAEKPETTAGVETLEGDISAALEMAHEAVEQALGRFALDASKASGANRLHLAKALASLSLAGHELLDHLRKLPAEEASPVETSPRDPLPESGDLTQWGLKRDKASLRFKGVAEKVKPIAMATIWAAIGNRLNEFQIVELLRAAYPDRDIDRRVAKQQIGRIQGHFKALRVLDFVEVNTVEIDGEQVLQLLIRDLA